MKIVQPKVWLVSKPSINFQGIHDYLEDVGGLGWLDRMLDGDNPSDADFLVEFFGRMCYRSWAPGLNPNVTKVRTDSEEYLHNVLASGHGSVTEHPSFGFVIRNCSRIFTHEIVRHRAGVAISQESMRYVRLDEIPMWFPEWALRDDELMARLTLHVERSENLISWMTAHFKLDEPDTNFAEKKAKTSFMRRFAPAGHATDIGLTINVRALRHIIYMRTNLAAEEEMRIICDRVAEETLQHAPLLMQDYSPNEHLEWVPTFLKV